MAVSMQYKIVDGRRVALSPGEIAEFEEGYVDIVAPLENRLIDGLKPIMQGLAATDRAALAPLTAGVISLIRDQGDFEAARIAVEQAVVDAHLEPVKAQLLGVFDVTIN